MSDRGHPSPTGSARNVATHPHLSRVQQQSLVAMVLRQGQCVIDVGCGIGTGTLALANAVGASGMVRGVDYDAAMIAEAQRLARVAGVDGWVSYHQANASALPWPDDYFHASRGDRVLQHMLDPERAFSELLRVTRPGGKVVVVDGDWATLSVDSDELDPESRRAYFEQTFKPANTLSGQCLRRLFARHGLVNIEIAILPVFEQDADVMGCWLQSCTPQSDAEGRFASANVVLISGCKDAAVA